MDQSVYKALLSDIKAGELKKALSVLSNNRLTNEAALNFVICCCNACVNTKSSFSGEDLLSTLKICSNAIHVLDDNLLDGYLRSTYYILKYFVSQKNVKHVVNLEFLLLPDHALNFNENPNKTIYQECSKVLYNFILKLYNGKPKIDSLDFLNVCVLYFKMCFEVSAADLVQQKLYNFFGYCWSFGVDALDLHKAYSLILNLLDEKKGDVLWNEDLCKSIFVLLSLLVKPLVRDQHFCHVKDVIRSTMNTVKSNFGGGVIDETSKVIDGMTVLLSEEKCHPSRKRTGQIFFSTAGELGRLIKSHGASAIVEGTCILCHTLIYNIVSNYESFSPTFWDGTMNETIQIDLFKLTKRVSGVYCGLKVKCPCGTCGLDVDFTSAYSCSFISGNLFKDYREKTSKTRQISDELLDEFKKHMDGCCEFIVKLKRRGCAKWKSLWKEIGAILYNASIDAQKLNATQRIAIKKLFLRYLTRFEGSAGSIILKDILRISLSCLASDYLELKEVSSALVTSALNIHLWQSERKALFLKWAHIKSECKDDAGLQQLNLASALVRHEQFIRSIHPDFKISEPVKIELLKFELEQYIAVWPSKMSISSVLSELHSLADVVTVAEALVQLLDFSSIHKYIYDLLKQVLATYKRETDNTTKNKARLACLYYMQYNACRENMCAKNNKDMERAFGVANEKKINTDHVIPNDECDIVTSYESLTLDRYNEAMKFLHEALNTFEASIDFDVVGILVENKIYNVLAAVAFEYRLQCYALEYFRACFLCLKVARMTFNKLQIIESIGYIIEKGNVRSTSLRSLMFEADQLIASLVGDDTVEKWETLSSFYISKSIALLLDGDVSASAVLYENARNAYVHVSKSKLLEMRLDHLQWLLFSLPCECEVEGHCYDSLVKPILTLHTAHDHYLSEGRKSSYFMVILFETYAALVRKFISLRLPRETRCYCKEVTLLAQRLLIPLQSVRFLGVLAEADLMSERFDDCLVKIHGMCEVLCISKHSRTYLTSKVKAEVTTPEGLLSNQFEEMMLNIPSSLHRQQRAAKCGSPVFETDQFKLPSFICHNIDCGCFHCVNIDFQDCVLAVLNLCGLLNAYQSSFTLSQEHYNNAMNIYNRLVLGESNFREKIFRLINHDVFPIVRALLLETYTSILLNVRDNVTGTPKFDEVNPPLGTIKSVNIDIYNEACLQNSANKMYHQRSKPVKAIELSPVSDREPENACSFLTPDSKCSTVKVPVTISPQEKPRKLFPVKKIKFHLSNEEWSGKDEPKHVESAKSIKFDLSDDETSGKGDSKNTISRVRKTPKTPAPPPPGATKVRNASAIKARQKKLDLDLNRPPDENKASVNKPGPVSSCKNQKSAGKLLKNAHVEKKPLKQIPTVPVTMCGDDDNDERAQELKGKQETVQEPRRSKRNQVRRESNTKDIDAYNKGALKKTLRN